MGQPRLPDIQTLIAMGFDPSTGLPFKFAAGTTSDQKEGVKRILRIQDEQQNINRYQWFNLPDGLNGQMLERIIYYRGQGMFFYLKATNKFYFLPFIGIGEVDCYGEYSEFTPLPFTGSSEEIDEKTKKPKVWINGLKYKSVDSILLEDIDDNLIENSCVLLYDYTKQLPQRIIPRQALTEPLLDMEAEMMPFMITALMNETGVEGVRVNNEDEYANVSAINKQVKGAALRNERFLATVGTVDYQQMPNSGTGTAADFMQAMESIDNFRLSAIGIDSNGLFAKKAHMLESEQAMAGGASSLVYDDGLKNRQRFCDIVNSIWMLGIECIPSENVTGDMNNDGMIADEQEQNGIPGEQQEEVA